MTTTTAEQAFHAVLDALDRHGYNVNHKPGSDKATALCPVHDKRNPSLSIGLKGDKVVLFCFAGCSYKDVVAALSLPISALFAQGRGVGALLSPRTDVHTCTPPPPSRKIRALMVCTHRSNLMQVCNRQRHPLWDARCSTTPRPRGCQSPS
jgi:hypothetical protein